MLELRELRKSLSYLIKEVVTVCEYAKYDSRSNKPLVLMCTVTDTLCTFCVRGNAQTYLMQKQKETNKGVDKK